MTMGQRIAEQRKRLGLSLEALGEKLDVSRQAVSKWEADGAVPSIDKLIAMSKLFGVSVGWLLGVEEQLESQEEPISEKQIEVLEQIVRKYHMPQKRRIGWLSVLVSLVAMVVAFVAISKMNSYTQNGDAQFQDSSSDYTMLQNQLQDLSDDYRVLKNQLGDVAVQLEAMEGLLSDYEVTAAVSEDKKGAEISFSGVPKHWQEGDTAYLCVQLRNQNIAEIKCETDGVRYTAKLTLPADNGYTYYYISHHDDGSTEQQLLQSAYYYASYIKDGLRAKGSVSVDVAAAVDSLTLKYAHVYLEIPPLYMQKESLIWTKLEAVAYKNDEELLRQDLFADWKEKEGYTGVSTVGLMEELPAENIPAVDGDVITLWIEAQVGEKLQFSHKAYTYECRGDSYKEKHTTEVIIE